MSNVYSLDIYRQLARMEQIADRMNVRGLIGSCCPACGEVVQDDLVLMYAQMLREACKDMSEALLQSQRARTEAQLRASLEMIGKSSRNHESA